MISFVWNRIKNKGLSWNIKLREMATTVDMRRQDTISETEKGEKQEQDLSEHKNAFVRWEKVAEWPQQSFQFLNDGFNCILRQLSFRFLVKLTKRKQQVQKKDIYMDILQPSRYKPSDLEQMAEDTKFTKGKLKTRQAACKRILKNNFEMILLAPHFQTRFAICTEPLNRSVPMELLTRKPLKKFTRRSFHWATLASMHTLSLPQLTGSEMIYFPSHPLSLLDFGRYTLITRTPLVTFYTVPFKKCT